MSIDTLLERRLSLPYIKTTSVLNYQKLLPLAQSEKSHNVISQKLQRYDNTRIRNWSQADLDLSKISKHANARSNKHITPVNYYSEKRTLPISYQHKKLFQKNMETMQYGWKEKPFDLTCHNRSSANYNIINQSPNANCNKKIECRHPKGFTEFIELNRTLAPNYQVQYKSVQGAGAHTFGIINGIAMSRLDEIKSFGPMFCMLKK
jgi:hypothetical protein